MKIKSPLFLLTLGLVFVSCQNYSGQSESQLVGVDTLQIIDFEIFVSSESALLGEPRNIVSMDEKSLAVYDHAYKKIIVFNSEGDKLYDFGSVGDGPGEWSAKSGAADLNFIDDRFITTNRDRFLFDQYDKAGNHLRSISFPRYLYFNHKTLIQEDELLTTTNGRYNALAAIMDLKNEDIIQKIGSPESEYSEVRNYGQDRIAYINGEIPNSDLNKALAVKGQEGYFIFMNALGELRHYSHEGELIIQQKIPEFIRTPIFDFIVRQNKEVVPERSVMPLEYIRGMQLHDDLIYLFMARPHPEALELDFRMLVYNTNGELLKHYVFKDSKNESFLVDFAITEDNNIYFIDIMSSAILKLSPDILKI